MIESMKKEEKEENLWGLFHSFLVEGEPDGPDLLRALPQSEPRASGAKSAACLAQWTFLLDYWVKVFLLDSWWG